MRGSQHHLRPPRIALPGHQTGAAGFLGWDPPRRCAMKLESFRVQNFRSVLDSSQIRLSQITVLVGGNQAGKTSLLQGLDKINSDASFDPFDLTQLEGVFKQYADGELKGRDIPIATVVLSVDGKDESDLRAALKESLKEGSNQLTLEKSYDNWYHLRVGAQEFLFPSRSTLEGGRAQLKQDLDQLGSRFQQHFGRHPNNQQHGTYQTWLQQTRAVVEEKTPTAQKLVPKIQEAAGIEFDSQLKHELAIATQRLAETAASSFPRTETDAALYSWVLAHLPRTSYFKTYERLEDGATLEELEKAPEQHRTFLNLLKLADLRIPTLRDRLEDDDKRHVYIRSADARVTKLLRKAWKQEALELEFRYSANRLTVFTKDSEAVETLVPPSSGSEGFQWWLGFYINFGAATDAEYRNAILLLDDPGVYLHPRGHKDLLENFESYLDRNVTTIYTTQLPSLVPRDRLDRLRLVHKTPEGKSVVEEKFYAGSNADALAPLRAALGASLGDSLFAGNITILVEGISDQVLIHGFLAEINRREARPHVDLEKVKVLAAGGASKLHALALVLHVQGLPYVVVLDDDAAGKKSAEGLLRTGVGSDKIVLIPRRTEPHREAATIEDLFSPQIFSTAFRRTHGETEGGSRPTLEERIKTENAMYLTIAVEALKSAGQGRRSLDKVSLAYELLRLSEAPESKDEREIAGFLALLDRISKAVPLYGGDSAPAATPVTGFEFDELNVKGT